MHTYIYYLYPCILYYHELIDVRLFHFFQVFHIYQRVMRLHRKSCESSVSTANQWNGRFKKKITWKRSVGCIFSFSAIEFRRSQSPYPKARWTSIRCLSSASRRRIVTHRVGITSSNGRYLMLRSVQTRSLKMPVLICKLTQVTDTRRSEI